MTAVEARRHIDTPEKMAAWLQEAIEGATRLPGLTAEKREEYGYKNLPEVRLTDEEEDDLREIKFSLDAHMALMDRELRKLCDTDRASAEESLTVIMARCFQIGMKTQYGDALVRASREEAQAGTSAARAKRSASREIVRNELEKLNRQSRPSDGRVTAGIIAGRIEEAVNAELKRVDLDPIKTASVTRAINRIWNQDSDI